jgi:hypothetical protein
VTTRSASKPGCTSLKPNEAAGHQAGRRDEHEGDGDLSDDEPVADLADSRVHPPAPCPHPEAPEPAIADASG